MKCPKCQSENPEGNRFCGECGGNLDIVCPGCNSSNPAEFKFCGKCGSELPPRRKSRQQVRALFSDLSGYTALTEKLDPEEVKEITRIIFDGISQIIRNYEGFIERFTEEYKGLESEPILTLKQMEKKYILNAYNRLNKNYSQTARMLGISRNTLKSKLKSYRIGKL